MQCIALVDFLYNPKHEEPCPKHRRKITMALTRKFLTALGIDEAKIDEIITAHTEVTDSLKAERDKFKADASKFAEAKAELDSIKAKAAEDGGKNPFEVKYKALKEEFDNFKKDTDAKATKAKQESAFRKLLKEAGVSDKRIDSVLKVSDISGIEFDDDGKVKDAEKLTESIKKEWSDFIPTFSQEGAPKHNPPSTTSGKVMTKDEIMNIKDTASRQKAIAENHELFGI
jgi:hypothetical protein